MIDKNTEQSMDRTEFRIELLPDFKYNLMTCSFDLKMVAFADDYSIRLMDLQSKKSYAYLVGHSDLIFSIYFSPDNKLFASGGRDKTLRVWDAQTGEQLHEFLQEDNVIDIQFSPDGLYIASSSQGIVRIWNLRSQESQELIGLTGNIKHINYAPISYSPNGRQLISGADYCLHLWDTKRLAKLRQIYCRYKKPILCVTIRNQIVAAAGLDYPIRMYNLRCFKQIRSLKSPIRCSCHMLCFSPNFDKLAAAFSNKVYSWDIQGNSKQLLGHAKFIHYLNFIDNQYLISAACDSLQVQLC